MVAMIMVGLIIIIMKNENNDNENKCIGMENRGVEYSCKKWHENMT